MCEQGYMTRSMHHGTLHTRLWLERVLWITNASRAATATPCQVVHAPDGSWPLNPASQSAFVSSDRLQTPAMGNSASSVAAPTERVVLAVDDSSISGVTAVPHDQRARGAAGAGGLARRPRPPLQSAAPCL